MNRLFLFALAPLAVGAEACCVPDAPEIGDIGPASTVVCRDLDRLYPGAAAAVTGRTIKSGSEVAVMVTVDGERLSLPYRLNGFDWQTQTGAIAAR